MDCDPGHDDAVALFMVLAAGGLDLRLITTCAGNQRPEKTFANARNLLALAGRTDIPVAAGAPKPLSRELVIADYVHGESGLDGAEIPVSTAPRDPRPAVDAIHELVSGTTRGVTILATGPLTNVATYLLAHPEAKSGIDRIVLMGGACFGGNRTPNAEFNIYVDPEAADIVFRSGVPIAMFGLDVTHKAQLFDADIERIAALGSRTGTTVAGLLRFFALSTSQPFMAPPGHVEGLHMHDPCAAAYLIDPSLFTMVPLPVQVITQDGPARGCTVVDYNNTTCAAANADVAFDLDRPRFAELVHASLAQFD
jgi:pyrimidine-specific ribonucleoside hydrolase